eukprot:4291194-Prymnesium_polylepis.1
MHLRAKVWVVVFDIKDILVPSLLDTMQRPQHVARGVPVVSGVKRARDSSGSTCVDTEERGGEIESGQRS